MLQHTFDHATFIGIDAHVGEHTALAVNRFEEERGKLTFPNTHEGIAKFLSWIPTLDADRSKIHIGIEGGGTERHALVRSLVSAYEHIYEINPLFTKQRRDYGTDGNKSDERDAKLIAEVLTKKIMELPTIAAHQLTPERLVFRKTIWFYEEITDRGAAITHQLNQVQRELVLAQDKLERHALTMIYREKEKERSRIRTTRKKVVAELSHLLPERGKNLTSIPGISTVLAARIIAHTDGIERFRNLDKFIRYAGIAPLERSSGKTRRFIKANRGNRKLNCALYMAALSQRRCDPAGCAYFEKKVAEGKTKKHALRCLMKRVACVVYGMLKNGEHYRRS